MNTNSKITIIGAGLAGLTIAYRLQQRGRNVTLYEARQRVGGRVFTVMVDGHIAELGGQNLLDGAGACHLKALIKELQLETERKKSLFQLYYCLEGEQIDIAKLIKEQRFVPADLWKKCQTLCRTVPTMREVLLAFFQEDSLLYRVCSAMLSGYEGEVVERLSSHYVETLYHFLLGGLSAAHPAMQERAWIEHLLIKGGNWKLPTALAHSLSSRLFLDHPLVEIAKTEIGSYLLTFTEGRKTTTDLLILTIPCPVLKELSISEAVLPKQRRIAMEPFSLGRTAKVLMPLLPGQERPGAYTDGRLLTFANRDSHILNLYYRAEEALFSPQKLVEKVSRDLPLLRGIYGVEALPPPIVAADHPFASYEGPVGHSWPSDPFARGSYSYLPAGQEEAATALVTIQGESVRALFAPVDHSLFFAGEHTSILWDVGGTLEAAVESGERTARLVEKCLKEK